MGAPEPTQTQNTPPPTQPASVAKPHSFLWHLGATIIHLAWGWFLGAFNLKPIGDDLAEHAKEIETKKLAKVTIFLAVVLFAGTGIGIWIHTWASSSTIKGLIQSRDTLESENRGLVQKHADDQMEKLNINRQLDNVERERDEAKNALAPWITLANSQYTNAPDAKRLDLLFAQESETAQVVKSLVAMIGTLATNSTIPPETREKILYQKIQLGQAYPGRVDIAAWGNAYADKVLLAKTQRERAQQEIVQKNKEAEVKNINEFLPVFNYTISNLVSALTSVAAAESRPITNNIVDVGSRLSETAGLPGGYRIGLVGIDGDHPDQFAIYVVRGGQGFAYQLQVTSSLASRFSVYLNPDAVKTEIRYLQNDPVVQEGRLSDYSKIINEGIHDYVGSTYGQNRTTNK